jgi:O-antigen ligase
VIATLAASSQFRHRLSTLFDAAKSRSYAVLFSSRVVPFLAAADMVRSRPLTGVGPGCFKFHFMDERLTLTARYPEWTRSWPEIYAETHNDHLQVAAETGLPGYAIFLTVAGLLGWTRRRRADDRQAVEIRFVEMLRPPLVTTFLVIALAQFPLQIAAPRLMFLTFAAIAMRCEGGSAQ